MKVFKVIRLLYLSNNDEDDVDDDDDADNDDKILSNFLFIFIKKKCNITK